MQNLKTNSAIGWLLIAAASGALVACGSSAASGDNGGTGNTGNFTGNGGGTAQGSGGDTNGGGNGGITGGGNGGITGGTTGGTTGSTTGGTTGSGGTTTANTDPCADPSGTWAMLFTTAVKWPDATIVITHGTGAQKLLLLSHRTYDPATKIQTDSAQICSLEIPSFNAPAAKNTTVTVSFPNAFNGKTPVDVTLTSTLAGLPTASAPANFSSDATAILVGSSMTNPVTDTWPDNSAAGAYKLPKSVDSDGDGNPGITAKGQYVPTDAFGANAGVGYADPLYLTFRTVAKVSGTQTCTKGNGTIDPSYSINQTILGCQFVLNGTTTPQACGASQLDFINQNSPVWSADTSTPSTLISERVADNATCATIIAAPPTP